MTVKCAISKEEKDELDQLLWSVLWEPLGFSRDIRHSFGMPNPEIDLIAVYDGYMVGGLVVNQLSGNEFEIRHIAVRPDYQGKSVGKRLLEALFRQIRKDNPVRIQTIARNTSVGFFMKLGFTEGEPLEHPDFTTQGISFCKMNIALERRT